MKCPNCGEEMAEGSLYCEHCGEDIHIVPDFDPELERDMEQTINGILEEIHEDMPGVQMEETQETGEEQEESEREKPVRRKRHWIKVLLVFIFFLLVTVSGMAWYIHNYNSEEYQAKRAAQYVEQGKYDEAIACYNRALEIDAGNIELIFNLADVYLLKNNKVEYEYLLREIISSKKATSEQLEGAYARLIGIYRDRGDYQTINDLLLASENDSLIAQYQNYIVKAPEFSVNEGYYTSIQPLKLSADGSGKIYYTMDGSEPTEESAQYTAPIILENGQYIIKAFFVNERGTASDVVTKEYSIDNNEILPPEISVLSGEYEFPIFIEVVNEEGDVYYTTDGSDPTYSSTPYTGPIPMPLGRSCFKFARIVDGVTGTIAERNYRLEMNTDFTPEEAVNSVIEYSLSIGKIFDWEGHFDESGDSYQYEYQYVRNINRVDDFYVIVEFYRTGEGNRTRTGNNFAVNAYTGQRFRLLRDERGNLSLEEIDQKEDSQ